jgi:hypothetical protein
MRIMAKYLVLILCLASIVASTACSLRLADLSAVSTKNVSLDKVDLDSLPQTKGIVGKDTKWTILFIPLGFPHLEDAIDDALDKGNGDVMIDAVLHERYWWFIIGQDSLEVKGTVVKTRKN